MPDDILWRKKSCRYWAWNAQVPSRIQLAPARSVVHTCNNYSKCRYAEVSVFSAASDQRKNAVNGRKNNEGMRGVLQVPLLTDNRKSFRG